MGRVLAQARNSFDSLPSEFPERGVGRSDPKTMPTNNYFEALGKKILSSSFLLSYIHQRKSQNKPSIMTISKSVCVSALNNWSPFGLLELF